MTTRIAWALAALIVAAPMLGTPKAEISAAAGQETTQQAQPGMQDMMKMHQQMMAEMKANRATLDALVQQMNGASGNAKVDATAAVVTELVRQHNTMQDRMGQMHGQMMGRGMMGGRNMMGH